MRFKSSAVALSQSVAAGLAVAAIMAAPMRAQAQAKPGAKGAWGSKTKGVGHYADVNGLKLYYEIHGSGRQLIAVDLQGHGRTADIDRPISVELMADDIAALIRHLGLQRSDIMGYSLGGSAGADALHHL